MTQLGGHPLAMRVILPKLEQMPALKVALALRSNLAELGLNEQEEQGRLFATLRFVEQGLAEELRPVLGLVSLHEGYVDADYLEAMAQQVDSEWTRPRIDQLMATLISAGLALRYRKGYLRATSAADELSPVPRDRARNVPASLRRCHGPGRRWSGPSRTSRAESSVPAAWG